MPRLSRIALWSAFAGALLLVAGLALLAHRSMRQSPRSAYEEGARAAFGPDRDPDLAFRQFDFALRGALAEGDRALAVEVLKSRARLFSSIGSLHRARSDYQELLGQHARNDLESQLALIRILVRLGEDEDAERLIGQVLARDPSNGSALASRAKLLTRAANQELASAQEAVATLMPESQRFGIAQRLRKMASLGPYHPRRMRLSQEVRTLLPAGEERALQTALSATASAGIKLRGARDALIGSFEERPTGESLAAFLDLALEAEEPEAAVAFALATARTPSAAAEPAFLDRTLTVLRQGEHDHLAAEALGLFLGDNVPTPELYERWCKLLYDQERWADLLGVANAFRPAAAPSQRSRALAYLGLAQAGVENWEPAQRTLQFYLLNEPQPPFEGGIALSWAALARAWREADRPDEELPALRQALRTSTGTGSGPAQDGELWLRLYELIDEGDPALRNHDELERALTHAISRLPERREELLQRWEDIGRRNLEAANVDLDLVLEEMLLDENFSAPGTSSPYETYQIARRLSERGLHTAVLRSCARLLREFRGFVPAIDLALSARLATRDLQAAAALLLERLETAPKDPSTLAQLEHLPPDAFTPDQVLQWMRADPAGAGRRRILAQLELNGLPGVAASGLLALPSAELRAADQIRAGELVIQLGHPEELEIAFEGLPDDPELTERARSLRLAAAMLLADWTEFDRLLAGLVESEATDGPGLHKLLEPLILRSPERAAAVAELLDSSARWRAGVVQLRLAQARLASGESAAAHTALERADASLEDGSPELGYLIEAALARDWGHMPERVTDLQRSRMEPTPIVNVLLGVLGERAAQAEVGVAANAERQTSEPVWGLIASAIALMPGADDTKREPIWTEEIQAATLRALQGAEGEPRDPRQLLAVVLAMQHPQWRAWAVARLLAGSADPVEDLWPAYLSARGLLLLEEHERAATLAEALVERWPEFRPGWGLLEVCDQRRSELLAGGRGAMPREGPDAVSWVRWRQRELIGSGPESGAEGHWLSALEAERSGDVRLALRMLSRALEIRPDDLRFRLTQIRLYSTDRDWVPALQSMNRALASAPEQSDGIVVERALALRLAAVAELGRMSLENLLDEQRELLIAHFSSDPLVALALAREDVTSSSAGPDIGLAAALRRLELFRTRTKGVPLEQLRAGSAEAWFSFLLPYDTALAGDLALQELKGTPGDPKLWRLLAQAAEASGDRKEALEILRFLQRALAWPEDARSLVRIEAHLGDDRDAFEDACAAVLAQESRQDPDDRLKLARAEFLLHSGPAGWDEAIEILEGLWGELQPRLAPVATAEEEAPEPSEEGDETTEGESGGAAAEGSESQAEAEAPALEETTEPQPSESSEPEGGEVAPVEPVEEHAPEVEPGEEPTELAADPNAEDLTQGELALEEDPQAGSAEAPAEAVAEEPLNPQWVAAVARAYATALLWRGDAADDRTIIFVLFQLHRISGSSNDAWIWRGLRAVSTSRAIEHARETQSAAPEPPK
jgi:hypothetical protein